MLNSINVLAINEEIRMNQIFCKYRHQIAWLGIVIGCYLMVGCGPIYNTEYSFKPPLTPEGKTCAFQCKNSELQCEQLEEMKKQSCQLQSQLECKDKKDCSSSSYCSTNFDRCKEMYRNCYQACGGTVESHKVCVMGC